MSTQSKNTIIEPGDLVWYQPTGLDAPRCVMYLGDTEKLVSGNKSYFQSGNKSQTCYILDESSKKEVYNYNLYTTKEDCVVSVFFF